LKLFDNAGLHTRTGPQASKFPCIFRDYRAGNGFADAASTDNSLAVGMFR